jgi:hypothetical protein
MVLQDGLQLASIGVVLGMSGAFLLSRAMASLVYGVSSTNVAVCAVVVALFWR